MLGKELERAGGITISLGLPSGSALARTASTSAGSISLPAMPNDGQRALGDVDLDQITFLDQGNWLLMAASGET